MLVKGIAADLLGRPLDFTYPIAYVLHTILLVPMPGAPAVAAAKPTAKPASKPAAGKGAAASKIAAKPTGSGKAEAKKTK